MSVGAGKGVIWFYIEASESQEWIAGWQVLTSATYLPHPPWWWSRCWAHSCQSGSWRTCGCCRWRKGGYQWWWPSSAEGKHLWFFEQNPRSLLGFVFQKRRDRDVSFFYSAFESSQQEFKKKKEKRKEERKKIPPKWNLNTMSPASCQSWSPEGTWGHTLITHGSR